MSAIRCFPEGCGSKTTEANYRVSQEAIACKDNGWEQRITFMEGMPFEETIKRHTHKKEEILQNMPRFYPPPRRISATRCFPQGCGRHATQASNEGSQEAIASKDNSLEHHITFVKSETQKNKEILQVMPRVYPPQRKVWANRCFPEGCGRKTPQSTPEVTQESIACITNSSVSQSGSRNQSQEKVPIVLALPAYTVTMLGWRGVPEYSWSQGKGTPRKVARGMARVKSISSAK